MKIFQVWIEVNDGEYLTDMVYFGKKCIMLPFTDLNGKTFYPIMVDENILYFGEKVVEIEEKSLDKIV